MYDSSLSTIFFRAGFDTFLILVIACVVLGLIAFFFDWVDSDGFQLVLGCFLMAVPISCVLPLISLLKTRQQEHILGIYWKDRTDFKRSAPERDWFCSYNLGGFVLLHRNYIQRILGSRVVEQTSDLGREKVYHVMYEDIRGKRHTIKFSSANEQKKFQQWYKSGKSDHAT